MLTACCMAAEAQTTVTLTVTNPLKTDRSDVPVVYALKQGDVRSVVVNDGTREIASQIDDLDGDGKNDEICFLCDIKGKETKQYTLTFSRTEAQRSYPARTYAELLLRKPKKGKGQEPETGFIRELTFRGDVDSYNYCQHHGVGFESDLCAFRIYFDKRQTVDAWGKINKQLELEATQFYPTAEQRAAGYGDDVLWVGQTFGGSCLRGWDGTKPTLIEPTRYRTQRVVTVGPVRSIIELVDEGWQPNGKPAITMTERYTVYGGQRGAFVDVNFDRNVADYQFSTGVINVKESEEITDHHGLRGCWGTDWASNKHEAPYKEETVGLAVCVPEQYVVKEMPVDKDNYGLVIATSGTSLHYAFAFASANESFGFKNAKEWEKYLKSWKEELSNPLRISEQQ